MARSEAARPFGERKQRLVLYVGLLFAALAAILVLVIVSGSGGGGGGTANVRVVKAIDVIPAGTIITTEMLEVTFQPADEVNVAAFSSPEAVVGRITSEELSGGAQILPSQVSDRAGAGLTFTVTPGMRAISIDAREVVTAGGNLQPGDEVDVVGVFEVTSLEALQSLIAVFAPGHEVNIPLAPLSPSLADALTALTLAAEDDDSGFESGGNVSFNVTVTLSQNTKVLALSQTAVGEPVGADGTFTEEPLLGLTEPRAVTATLEVTPAQAQMMVLANQYGALRLSLRSFDDDGVAELAPVITLIDRNID